MASTSVFSELIASIADRGLGIIDLGRTRVQAATVEGLGELCDQLLSGRGEASGIALAKEILKGYGSLEAKEQKSFFQRLARDFSAPPDALSNAASAYLAEPSDRHAADIVRAAEPRRQELLRRLNHAPNGTLGLVRMRQDLLSHLKECPELSTVDTDFGHLFTSWFNRGFLELRRIDWRTSAAVLEKVIEYEAVHAISGWDELRARIDPPDRRLYGFFHPSLGDEPLIFVEVALTREMSGSVQSILAKRRDRLEPEDAKTAMFYSISNCQVGLRGVSFGNFLIKQVVQELQRELPGLRSFATLSPIPGFARWIAHARGGDGSGLKAPTAAALSALDEDGWWRDRAPATPALEKALTGMAARYFLLEKDADGRPIDPVARFHLGNGARLERINWLADKSSRGLRQSHGLMVNYLYKLDDIEKNHEAFANAATVAASGAVARLAKAAG